MHQLRESCLNSASSSRSCLVIDQPSSRSIFIVGFIFTVVTCEGYMFGTTTTTVSKKRALCGGPRTRAERRVKKW